MMQSGHLHLLEERFYHPLLKYSAQRLLSVQIEKLHLRDAYQCSSNLFATYNYQNNVNVQLILNPRK